MTLSPGSRLGPYEIVAPLGSGGMGEVYRARDRRLARDVAIKVLPLATSADSERVKRFEREARAASSLNHPNIITIYDIGSEDGVSYIAMELVEGSQLRNLQGPLETRQLLEIAVQMAEALTKAHAAGIVHRDLKPENVMLTKDQRVKVLDFGLAKLTQPESAEGSVSEAATALARTRPGMMMGTMGYMSPEQAVGEEIDFRSDQFSFGAILYEMATGRRAFVRGSAAQTLSAILNEEPEQLATANPRIPAPLRWIVERCLAKKPGGRYASTEDLALELATIRNHLSETTSAIGAGLSERTQPRRHWIAWTVAAVFVAAAATFVWQLQQRDYFWTNPLAGARFTRLTDWEGTEDDAAISADGKFVAFLSDHDGPVDVWVTQLGSGEFHNLTKGQYPNNGLAVHSVGFSGDGSWVWFALPAKGRIGDDIWVIPTLGGTPRPFLPRAVEAAWSPDRNRIVYHTNDPGDPTFVADSNGRNPSPLFTDKPNIHNHYPIFSPDGSLVYFARGQAVDMRESDIWRISAAGGRSERLTHQGFVGYPTFVDNRTLLYVASREDRSGNGLYAMDTHRLIPHAVSFGLEEYTSIAASADGRRLVASVANPTRNLSMVPISDRIVDESEVRPFNLPSVRAAAPRFSPDSVLYLSSAGRADGVWKLKNGSATELWKGSDGAVAAPPAVSPDGTEISFIVEKDSRGTLYRMASDGTGAQPFAAAVDARGARGAPSWSPDGKWIAIVAREGDAFPVLKIPVDGGAPVRLVGGTTRTPVWSPDGRYILYSEIQPKGGPGRLRAITPGGKPFPVPDISIRQCCGRYRFLPSGKAVVVTQGEIWQPNFYLLDLATSHLRQLTNLRAGSGMKEFDVSPDGKQILFDRYRENADIVLIEPPPR